jgi:hypothetical protein
MVYLQTKTSFIKFNEKPALEKKAQPPVKF